MWSRRRVPVTRRAAAFCRDCRRLNSVSVMPYCKQLQLSRRHATKACTTVLAASAVSERTIGRSWRNWKKPPPRRLQVADTKPDIVRHLSMTTPRSRAESTMATDDVMTGTSVIAMSPTKCFDPSHMIWVLPGFKRLAGWHAFTSARQPVSLSTAEEVSPIVKWVFWFLGDYIHFP